jgi:hypothetical protein
VIHFARECLQRPFAEFRTRPNRAIKGVLLQNRRPEKPLHARGELRTEDLESLGGDCSGCMRRHSWPVIAQADVRSGGRGARKWLRLRYCASERNNTPLRARRGWGRHHFATRFSRRLVRISPHHAAVGESNSQSWRLTCAGIGGSAATAGGYDADGGGHNMAHLMFYTPLMDGAAWGANSIDDSNHVSFKFPNSPIFLTPQFLGDPELMDNFVVPTGVWSDGTPDRM